MFRGKFSCRLFFETPVCSSERHIGTFFIQNKNGRFCQVFRLFGSFFWPKAGYPLRVGRYPSTKKIRSCSLFLPFHLVEVYLKNFDI